jgi:hypothetical protein
VKPVFKKIVFRVSIGLAMAFAFYVLSFGPVWGLYKRGYVFSKDSIRFIYTPLVELADQHICPLDWPGRLLWQYAALCAPLPNSKVLSTDDTFD